MEKSKTEVIKETVEYISKDPENRRSFNSERSACLYVSPNGNHCGFGMWLKPELKKLIMKN